MPQNRNLLNLILVILLLAPAGIMAQLKNPIKWNYSAKNLTGSKYELHMTATLEKGWHIYSQKTPPGGPIPTKFTFTKTPLVTTNGAVKELGNIENYFEELFGVQVMQYADKVDFVQTVTVKNNVKTNLAGKVEYQLCRERECLLPKELAFSIVIE